MKAVSINLNKGLRTGHRFEKFLAWLHAVRPELLLAQEPVKQSPSDVSIPGYAPIGGNELAFAWIRIDKDVPTPLQPLPYCLAFEHAGYAWFNCYLDCYSNPRRGAQILQIHSLAGSSPLPVIIVGDFNMAPNPEDGLYDGRHSDWSNRTDRTPLSRLLAGAQLADLKPQPDVTDFTYEKSNQGKLTQFRCDLALVSVDVVDGLSISYDHGVRKGSSAFTDHSAVVLDYATLAAGATHGWQNAITSFQPPEAAHPSPLRSTTPIFPHKTAIRRTAESSVARFVVRSLIPGTQIKSVLDFGCGRGRDLQFYRGEGLDAEGWDPHEQFGFSVKPNTYFDLVVLAYILNVLPTPEERIHALQEARRYLKGDAAMFVVTRSIGTVQKEAHKGNWPSHEDGFLSDARKGTFQVGLDRSELLDLAREAGLMEITRPGLKGHISDASWVLLGQ